MTTHKLHCNNEWHMHHFAARAHLVQLLCHLHEALTRQPQVLCAALLQLKGGQRHGRMAQTLLASHLQIE